MKKNRIHLQPLEGVGSEEIITSEIKRLRNIIANLEEENDKLNRNYSKQIVEISLLEKDNLKVKDKFDKVLKKVYLRYCFYLSIIFFLLILNFKNYSLKSLFLEFWN